jgi:hypothetical protein
MHWLFLIIAILLSLGAGYWVLLADKRRAVPYPWLTALLRAVVVFLACWLLLAPAFTLSRNETEKPVVLFLQDDSRSVADALKNDSAAYRKNVTALLEQLSDKYHVIRRSFNSGDSLFRYKQQSTDISAALSRTQDFLGEQNIGAVILATDGRYNQGVNPLYQNLALRSSMYTVAIGDSNAAKDIRIAQTYANKTVALNSQFEIRADMIAELCNGYNNRIQLHEVNGDADASENIAVSSDRYDRSVSFTVRAATAGLHHYVITVPVADGEQNTANNRRDVFVSVTDEKKNILIAAAAPHPDVNALKEALSALEGYHVTVATPDRMPENFSGYQVLILHNLPAAGTNIVQKIQAANKPVWYVLGAQSDINAVNQLQRTARLNMNSGMMQDAFAVYNPSFSGFTLPQTVQAVFDKMPPLSIPAGNLSAAPDAYTLLVQRGGANPLWLLRPGNVPAALLAGEGIWRWRLYEYKNTGQHIVIDECIRQTVSFLAAANSENPFRVELSKYVWSDQEAVTLNAYLLNANNEQVNTPEVQLTITDSAGYKENFSFERSGTAYRLNTGIHAGGTYRYEAKTVYNGKTYTAAGSYVIESMPLELMQTGADYPLLYSLAKKYNGSLVPARNVGSLYDAIVHNNNIKPLIRTRTEAVPLIDWKWYFFLLLLVAVAEWLLRKYWLAQ